MQITDKVSLFEIYRHYKGNYYMVVGLTKYSGNVLAEGTPMISYIRVEENMVTAGSFGRVSVFMKNMVENPQNYYSQEETRFLETVLVQTGEPQGFRQPRFQKIMTS